LTYTGCTERRRQRAMRLRDELTVAEKALIAAEIDRARYERDFDGLTGLANRPTFCRRLDQMIAAGTGRPIEIVCFDVEGFNAVNATHGHAAGDTA
ncbi:diguanylate cyclase, partial [Acinetobacter baumannii]